MRSTARCWPYAPPPRWPCKCSAILPTTTATPATAPIRRCGRGRCAWWPRPHQPKPHARGLGAGGAVLLCTRHRAVGGGAARRCRHRTCGLAAVAAAGRGGHCGGFRLHRRPQTLRLSRLGRFFGVAVFRLAGRARQRVAAKRAIAPFCAVAGHGAGALVQHGAQSQHMRDISSDLAAGKRTIAARLGLSAAKRYHAALLAVSVLLWWLWLPLAFDEAAQGRLKAILLLLAFIHLYFLKKAPSCSALDKLLPQWSLSILAWVLLLWFFI